MPRKDLWSREELIVTLALYFQLPFGRLNHGTPEVKALAAIMGRTDNSVAIRLTNFAACDPYIINSGRHGMSAGVKVCQPIWDEFCNDKERLFLEAEIIKSKMTKQPIEKVLHISEANLQGKDRESVVKQRVNQNVFRTMILNNYESTCAITGINIPSMLIASHIIPWADDEENRLNPENGIFYPHFMTKHLIKAILPSLQTIIGYVYLRPCWNMKARNTSTNTLALFQEGRSLYQ